MSSDAGVPASAAAASASSSNGAASSAPAPVMLEGELHYTHTTFLTTLTDAFTDALKSAAATATAKLSDAERTDVVPDYYVEATRAALRQVLAQQYSPEIAAAYSATFTQSAAASPQASPQPEPAANGADGADAAPKKKPIRTYIDGCFDIMHSGHYNAIRQAKALTDILVVGVHSDDEIRKHKGPPVMNNEERLATVRACKWVDEVVFDTPYNPSLELLIKLNCDYCVHGDDLSTTADGRDAYAEVKEAGRMKVVKRTEGVSTTDLVGRLLLMTRGHHIAGASPALQPASPSLGTLSAKLSTPPGFTLEPPAVSTPASTASPVSPAHVRKSSDVARPPMPLPVAVRSPVAASSPSIADKPISNFLPTTWRITQFSNHKTPLPTDKIVYIDGAFDLFHVGHIETLKAAKAQGTFLYVGVHDDQTVNKHKGKNFPIMHLHERVMNVLSCRYVDEVVIGAPWFVTKDLITTLNLHVVCSGSNTKMDEREIDAHMPDPYAEAKAQGLFKEIETTHALTTEDVVRRLIKNRDDYEKRNAKRAPKEASYLSQQKQFIREI